MPGDGGRLALPLLWAKRRLMAIDVRNDALGRMGTIRTLIELLFGRRAGALVCRRWRDASRGLALTEGEEDSLVRAVAADHTNPHLLANLRYYDVTWMDLRRDDGTDSGPSCARLSFGLAFFHFFTIEFCEQVPRITTIMAC
jgi:hypothetical protein